MKITAATIYHVKGEGLKPVIVKLDTDEGFSGLGEAAPSYGTGGGGTATMIGDLSARFLIGQDPLNINALVAEMYDQSFWLKNPGGVAGGALSALEQALWDIRARTLEVPVHALFGGRMRDSLCYYVNGWYFGAVSKLDVLKKAEVTASDGHRALKFYPLADIQPNGTLRHVSNRNADKTDAVRCAAAFVRDMRAAVGPEVQLMLDLAGGLSTGDTVEFCRRIEEYDIAFVEEICDPGNLGALNQISPRINIQIATGERQYLRHGFRDLFEARNVSILQPDIGNVGGFAEAHKIAAMADTYGVKVQPHVCGSTLAAAVGMHFSACIPNFYIQEHFPYWDRIPGWIETATERFEDRVSSGVIRVDTSPGFGVTLDEAMMANHVVAQIR